MQLQEQKINPKPFLKNPQNNQYVNTHNHIDYGGDDAEHSFKRSKIKTEAERKEKYLMYRGG